MKLKIEFYGRLKTEFSHNPIEFEVAEAAETVIEDVYNKLCIDHNITPSIDIVKPILNDTFANWNDQVQAGDVVGFFPPASGG